MVGQIIINYWFPYINRYLEVNNLSPTKKNIRDAFEDHKDKLFQESGLKLSSKYPNDEIIEEIKRIFKKKRKEMRK